MEKWIVCACERERARIGFDDMNKSAAHLFVWQPNMKWLKLNKSIAYEKYQWKISWTKRKTTYFSSHIHWTGSSASMESIELHEWEWAQKKVAKKEITKSNQWFKLKTETNRQQEEKENETQGKWKLPNNHIYAWDDEGKT